MKDNRTSVKRSLFVSAIALTLTAALLIGTTFAWFTSTAQTSVSDIQAGTLNVEIVDEKGTAFENNKISFVNADNSADVLWEPNATFQTQKFKIKSSGTLALTYKLTLNVPTGDNVLLDNIDFSVVGNDGNAVSLDDFEATLTPDNSTSEVYTIKGHMRPDAQNDCQGKTLTGISLAVVAKQATYEKDSNGSDYDNDAEYPISVTTGDELQDIVNKATAPVNIVLTNNITTNNFVIPADKDVTLDLNGFTLTGGDSHAILNRGKLCIKDSNGNGKIVASKAETSALRNAAICVIDGGTFTRAEGEDNKWHTVENFGTMTFNGGKVIAEDNQSFAIVNGWNYINPGEQKATMTINNIEMTAGPNGFKNCAGGTLTMNGGTLHCTGYWGLSNDSTGVATINGGEITSDTYVAISNGGAKMEINGGTFTGPQGSLYVQNYAQDTVVKGGSYQNETVEFMRNYCPDGYTATLKDGMVVVSKN